MTAGPVDKTGPTSRINSYASAKRFTSMRSPEVALALTVFSSRCFSPEAGFPLRLGYQQGQARMAVEVAVKRSMVGSVGQAIPCHGCLQAIVCDAEDFLRRDPALAGRIADIALTKPLSRQYNWKDIAAFRWHG